MLTPQRLEHLAGWAGLEQDVHWQTMSRMDVDGWRPLRRRRRSLPARRRPVASRLGRAEGLARSAGEQEQFERPSHGGQGHRRSVAGDVLDIRLSRPRITAWANEVDDLDMAYPRRQEGFEAERYSPHGDHELPGGAGQAGRIRRGSRRSSLSTRGTRMTAATAA